KRGTVIDMSEASENELERMVEQQARGESAVVPVEGMPSGAAELDTRRSKSALAGGPLLGQGVNVDIPIAPMDTQDYIAQQTGVEHFQVDTGPGPSLAADPHPIISTGINVNVTDVVDTPEHIYAHMGMSVGGVTPGVVDVPTPDVLQADA